MQTLLGVMEFSIVNLLLREGTRWRATLEAGGCANRAAVRGASPVLRVTSTRAICREHAAVELPANRLNQTLMAADL